MRLGHLSTLSRPSGAQPMPSKSLPRPTESMPAIWTTWLMCLTTSARVARLALAPAAARASRKAFCRPSGSLAYFLMSSSRSLTSLLAVLCVFGEDFGVEEVAGEIDLHDAVLLAEGGDHFVGHVARGGGEGAAGGVGGEDGRLADFERVAEGLVGDVRDIDDHAEAVHLGDDFLAERREAVVGLVGVAGGIGPVVAVGVGEGHVAHAEVVEIAQQARAVFDGVAAFDAEQGGDLVLACGRGGCRRRWRRTGNRWGAWR